MSDKKLHFLQDYGSFIALIVLVIAISFVSADFRSFDNFL